MPTGATTTGAVILAAGRGSRLGGPKALLPLGKSTFLEHIIAKQRSAGIDAITVVVSAAIAAQAAEMAVGCRLVVNPDPAGDMMSSVRLGIESISSIHSCFITPVDHPFVRAATYKRLIAVLADNPDCILIPERNSKGGHPILIPWNWTRYLLTMTHTHSLAVAIKESGARILRVPVNDAGILRNINTPLDLEGDSKMSDGI